MGRIVRLHDDRHEALQDLLPWYATGQLSASEHAEVEAHLHGCAECQAELRFHTQLGAEIRRLPVEVEQGWLQMQQRLAQAPARRRSGSAGAWLRSLRARSGKVRSGLGAPWLGWAVASLLLVVTGVTLAPRTSPPAPYRALGSASAASGGNLVVIFRPDTSERAMRETLNASHARLVDGPTPADAYVLRVPPTERLATLARLRARADIVLAEPIDPAPER